MDQYQMHILYLSHIFIDFPLPSFNVGDIIRSSSALSSELGIVPRVLYLIFGHTKNHVGIERGNVIKWNNC